MLVNKVEGERKLKLLFGTNRETMNQSLLLSTEKLSMQKETKITPSKEKLKTTWITHAFQVQNKLKPTHENEMYIFQFQRIISTERSKRFQAKKRMKNPMQET